MLAIHHVSMLISLNKPVSACKCVMLNPHFSAVPKSRVRRSIHANKIRQDFIITVGYLLYYSAKPYFGACCRSCHRGGGSAWLVSAQLSKWVHYGTNVLSLYGFKSSGFDVYRLQCVSELSTNNKIKPAKYRIHFVI